MTLYSINSPGSMYIARIWASEPNDIITLDKVLEDAIADDNIEMPVYMQIMAEAKRKGWSNPLI